MKRTNATKKVNTAPIAGNDELEQDFSTESLIAYISSITKTATAEANAVIASQANTEHLSEVAGNPDDFRFESAVDYYHELLSVARNCDAAWRTEHGIDGDCDSFAKLRLGDDPQELATAWIERNDSRIRSIVKSFLKSFGGEVVYSQEDLLQEAYFAVCSAAKHYDPCRGDQLSCSCYFQVTVCNRMKFLLRRAQAKRRTILTQVSFEDCAFDLDSDTVEGRQRINQAFVAKDNVEDTIVNRDKIASILNSITDEKLRQILKMTAMSYTQSEISAYVGGTQSCISYDLKKMRKEIAR